MSKKKNITPQSFYEFLESQGDNQKVKLYSHDGTFVKVIEMTKDEAEQFEIGYRHGWFNSYEDAKEDLEFNKRIEFIVGDNSKLRARVKQLEKDVTMVGDRGSDFRDEISKVVSNLGNEINRIEKECKKGQDLLLDRIKELESELEPKEEGKVKKELNVFEVILAIGIGWILGFGLFHLVN